VLTRRIQWFIRTPVSIITPGSCSTMPIRLGSHL
jgi:hypothetical protein